MTAFEQLLHEALQCPRKEIDAFFEDKFLLPLQNNLDNNPEIPAEIIRQQRIQTKKIKNILLTFANKPL